MVPLFVAAFFLPYFWGAWIAVGLFILAAATDFLDGYIARKYNMVTDLGKLLDPIADKVLVCAALFCIVLGSPLNYLVYYLNFDSNAEWPVLSNYVWLANLSKILLTSGAIVIISRELLISAVRQIAASKGVVLQANVFGKVKTVFQDVSLPMLLLVQGATNQASREIREFTPSPFWAALCWIALALFVVAVVLTIVSGVIYLVQNKKVFAN